jgi:hypothetical protein
MGTFNFAPVQPVSAHRRARVAQNVRRVVERIGVPKIAVQRAVRVATGDLDKYGDEEGAVLRGLLCALAEERRLAGEPKPWPRSFNKFVGDAINAFGMVTACAVVIGVAALLLGWRP